ncbi:ATP-dependent DNA helicase [Allostreptomyces psammosilenae]|uniref:DNA 3'-5' helicase n=1 Tax=Allostreptomyces psammosilenae TaxID=1892865 RepID=A0A853A6T9_9ACTN|nr:ATP-dependent DNA helicase [Allostreptomyces psammosilenae]NYI06258.1 DNA helicase-2/ATP-dependent DNA helicase PcrA [Allostreptomyces psammosilenae]
MPTAAPGPQTGPGPGRREPVLRPVLSDPERLKELLGIPFTAEQMAAIVAPLEPGVIVAGAGSGKTTVMSARVVWLVGTGQVRPEQVLGLTFTNKAAGELAERVRSALRRAGIGAGTAAGPGGGAGAADDEPLGEPEISTYHAFAGRLLKEHGLRIGVEPSARLLADATRFQLAARVLRAAPGPYPALTWTFADTTARLLKLDGELAEHLVTPEQLRAHDRALLDAVGSIDPDKRGNAWVRPVQQAAAARLELAGLVDGYRQAKAARDLLDFGDQIALAARLAQTRPEVGRLLREQFRVVLLDEYQDTSVAQRLLLGGLFGAPRGVGHPVTAVGDPCQAIYGWRGASVANLDDFPHHFPRSDGTPAARYSLSENRRSGGRILDFANDLAAPLRELHQGVAPLRPAPGAERDGRIRCALLRTHDEEITWLADTIAHLVRTDVSPGRIAVLCRAGTSFADIHAALVARDVPVEVVGLSGLLNLPEIADLVAVCEVLQDPTANAALVRLLIGPRWRIGARDLALLGRRARDLVGGGRRGGSGAAEAAGPDGAGLDAALAEAVSGVDPTEVVSLADALEDPGDELRYSPQARVRFARLASEIRELRRSLELPLMDVLHRVMSVTGLDVELSASPHALAARRRETLHAFLDVAASFADLDGDPSLAAFLAFLRSAAAYDRGLDSTLPAADDSVKVLTAHKSKGLEWDVVAVPGLVKGAFPTDQGREKWTRRGEVLPHPLRGDAATLPEVAEWSAGGLKAFDAEMKEHDAVEELRLGYVAFTRPRELLLASGHWWGPTQKRPRGPSEFLDRLREHCERGHGEIEVWEPAPEEGEENPTPAGAALDREWPLPLDPAALAARREAAERVLARLDAWERHPERVLPAQRTPGERAEPEPEPELEPGPVVDDDDPPLPPEPDEEFGEFGEYDAYGYEDDGGFDPYPEPEPPGEYPEDEGAVTDPPGADGPADGPAGAAGAAAVDGADLGLEETALVASWDRDLEALAGELLRLRQPVREVPLPPSLSATALMRLAQDPDGFARDLVRPMPRPPMPAARRGTRFHAWVESLFDVVPLVEPEEIPGAEDEEIDDELDLEALKRAFRRTPYASRRPHRVEAPFQLVLGDRVVRGRIDAVYREEQPDGTVRYEVVDWKTSRRQTADPLQLAVYRLAWAERTGVPVERVTAAFLYVRTGEVVQPADLPGRAELERLVSGGRPDPSDDPPDEGAEPAGRAGADEPAEGPPGP